MYFSGCLICLSPTTLGISPCLTETGCPEPVKKELEVVFILRKVFELPHSHLENFLELSGGENPSGWDIKLCKTCQIAVDNLKALHQKMLEISHKFNLGKKKLVGIVQKTTAMDKEEDKSFYVEETRKWINNHNYAEPAGQLEPLKPVATISSCSPKQSDYQHLSPDVVVVEEPVQVKLKVPSMSSMVPSPSSTTNHNFSLPKVAHFQCSSCSEETFPTSGKLKEHAVLRHPENFFPPSQFLPKEQSSISLENYQACCIRLFNEEKLTDLGNNCWSCSICSGTYFSKPPVWVHLVENHYSRMAENLKLMLNRIVPGSSATQTSQAFPGPNPQPKKSIQSAQQLQNSAQQNGCQVTKKKRSDAKHPAKLKCNDCGTLFGKLSNLHRHKSFHCSVRRQMGLLKFQQSFESQKKEKFTSKKSGDHKCDDCGATYVHYSSLCKHWRVSCPVRLASGRIGSRSNLVNQVRPPQNRNGPAPGHSQSTPERLAGFTHSGNGSSNMGNGIVEYKSDYGNLGILESLLRSRNNDEISRKQTEDLEEEIEYDEEIKVIMPEEEDPLAF